MSGINRRKFLTGAGTAMAALGAGVPRVLGAVEGAAIQQEPEAPMPTLPKNPIIGIQIDAVSFLDEGTEKVLDILQEKGGVNALFMGTFSYGTGITGRQIQGHPFPDHGIQQYQDFSKGHGGDY